MKKSSYTFFKALFHFSWAAAPRHHLRFRLWLLKQDPRRPAKTAARSFDCTLKTNFCPDHSPHQHQQQLLVQMKLLLCYSLTHTPAHRPISSHLNRELCETKAEHDKAANIDSSAKETWTQRLHHLHVWAALPSQATWKTPLSSFSAAAASTCLWACMVFRQSAALSEWQQGYETSRSEPPRQVACRGTSRQQQLHSTVLMTSVKEIELRVCPHPAQP